MKFIELTFLDDTKIAIITKCIRAIERIEENKTRIYFFDGEKADYYHVKETYDEIKHKLKI